MISTLRKTDERSHNREDRKPDIILDYNRNKGGVDNLDKIIRKHSCIFQVSTYNTFVIWLEMNPSWTPWKKNKRRMFLEMLGKSSHTFKEGSTCPAQKLFWPQKMLRRLNPGPTVAAAGSAKRKQALVLPVEEGLQSTYEVHMQSPHSHANILSCMHQIDVILANDTNVQLSKNVFVIYFLKTTNALTKTSILSPVLSIY